MNDLEKIKRHLGKPIPITITNEDGAEDVFHFKSLNVEQQAILMELSKNMEKRLKIEVSGKEVPDITKEDMNEMFELVLDIVKTSMPELDEETAKEFTNNNFEQISSNLEKLIPKGQDKSKVELIKKRQEALNDTESTK